jgi:hypothetical protein
MDVTAIGGGVDISESQPPEVTPSARWRRTLELIGLIVWPLLAVLALAAFVGGTLHLARAGMPLFVLDEHVHTDYVSHLWDGQLPYRGMTYSAHVVYESDCGVGLVNAPTSSCTGQPLAGPLAGSYSTAYIHYPTYFLLARLFISAPSGPGVDIGALRLFSSFVMLAGLASLWLLGLVARLRGAQLAAIVTVPAAAAIFFLMGGYFNPSSSSLGLGALIAAGGLAWLRGRRGFWFFLIATSLASVTAITSVMPAAAFFLYGLWVYGGRLLRRSRDSDWKPTWWQLALVALAVAGPWFVWGRWIAASATVGNGDLYGFAAVKSMGQLARSLAMEAVTLHTPWYVVPIGTLPAVPTAWYTFASNIQESLPPLITVLVFGALVTAVITRTSRPTEPMTADGLGLDDEVARSRAGRDLAGVGAGLLLILWLYPPILHLTNALTFGIDYPIVTRYSMAFTPLMVVLALKLVPQRVYAWMLALSGVAMMVAMAYALPLPAK